MKRYFFFIALVVLMAGFIISGFTSILNHRKTCGVIKGDVTDIKTGLPLECVSLAVYNSKDMSMSCSGLSDAEGKFVFNNLPTGKYYIIAYLVGFKKISSQNLEISNKKSISNYKVKMERINASCGIIEINAERI